MAAAVVLRKHNKSAATNRVIIGKDTRLSGYMFEEALSAGFLAMGLDVILTGPIPTPAISMLTRSLRADLGVMVSASHNPYQDNGVKLFGADGYKLDDALEHEIEQKMKSDLSEHLAPPEALGKATQLEDASGRYVEYLKSSLPQEGSFAGLKIVLDCANGAAYKIAPQLFWEMECSVEVMAAQPDGRNINENCGATQPEALAEMVKEKGADIGLAFDGDADRLVIVDEKGQVVDGDQLLAAMALSYREQGKLCNNALVCTVMSNLGLERFAREKKIDLIRTNVGDRYVVEAMREGGYTVGGEQSGHIILADYNNTGDALLAALQVLQILKSSNKPASQTFTLFHPVPQIKKSVKYSPSGKQGSALLEEETVKNTVATIQKDLDEKGRVLVRASGTEPVIRIMAEGDDIKLIEQSVDPLTAVIEKAAKAG